MVVVAEPGFLLLAIAVWGFYSLMFSDCGKQFARRARTLILECSQFLFAYMPGSIMFIERRQQRKELNLLREAGKKLEAIKQEQRLERADSKNAAKSQLLQDAASLKHRRERELAIFDAAKVRMASVVAKFDNEQARVSVRCMSCDNRFALKRKYQGKKIRCPNDQCGVVIRVPSKVSSG